MVVAWNDAHDCRRDLQFCGICFHGRHLGHTSGRSCCCGNCDIIGLLPQGATELRRMGCLFHVYRGIRHYHVERARTVGGVGHSGDAALCHCSGIPQLCRCHHRWMRHCCLVRWTAIRKEEHDGLPDNLFSDWRAKRCCNARSGSCYSCPDQRRGAVQQVVHVCSARLCDINAVDGDCLSECE